MEDDSFTRSKLFFDYLAALLDSGLTANERWVATVIAKHADGWRDSFAKVETLARETGLGTATVKRATKVLVEKKWLLQTHSGRGGSSRLANSYDLNIPEDDSSTIRHPSDSQAENFGDSKDHTDTLQRITESRQRITESRQRITESVSKDHCDPTSTPSSTPRSTNVPTAKQGRLPKDVRGTKERGGDSYWVGTSRKYPDGYFIRVEGNSRPKGNVVQVDLTRDQVMWLFGDVYDFSYEQRRDFMIEQARQQGLGSDGRALG